MKYRAQAHQLLTWRRAHRTQEELVSRLQREKAEQLKSLSSQLLLFESRLVRKQKEITNMLALRETIIIKQQKVIESLQAKLLDNGIDSSQNIPDFRDMLQDTHITGDFDSLNDSDSAVIMEDVDYDSNAPHIPRFRSTNPDSVTVVRSISDAIDPNVKYSVVRRSNGFLRRPEILETVYSVEEEVDGDSIKSALSAQNSTEKDIKEANKTDEEKQTSLLAQRRDNFRMRSLVLTAEVKSIDSEKDLKPKSKEVWSYSYVPKRMTPANDSEEEVTSNVESDEDPEPRSNHVVTYNRVMSNHRNVTKPKDVKYKRINKAKSKSLEELRGRLKNWVEKGSKLSNIPLEHAQSYA